MDKIYSRIRLKKYKVILALFLFFIAFIFIWLIKFILPVFKANCLSRANSIGVRIVNEEVRKVMAEYTYDDLIVTHTNNEGEITFLESNIISVNEIITKIISNIQAEIDRNDSSKVYLNMGTISGISFLKNIGPSISISLETGGYVKAKINTEFSSSGINQTLHRVYVDIDTSVKVVTPVAILNKEIESRVLIAEAIIVGEIPSTYYNLEGLTEGDAMEVMGD